MLRRGAPQHRSGKLDGQSGRFWFSVYSLTMLSGAPPQEAAKWLGDQKCSPHRYLWMWLGNSWRSLRAETPLSEPTSRDRATFGG